MPQRINAYAIGNQSVNALHALGQKVNTASLQPALLELVYYRVSQLNGCAFCLDMHSKNLLAKGESPQRLFTVSAWRETPFFTEQEKAALRWAEALTQLNGREIPDEIFQQVHTHFPAQELVDLTMAVITINAYNRINLAFGANVGAYQVSA